MTQLLDARMVPFVSGGRARHAGAGLTLSLAGSLLAVILGMLALR